MNEAYESYGKSLNGKRQNDIFLLLFNYPFVDRHVPTLNSLNSSHGIVAFNFMWLAEGSGEVNLFCRWDNGDRIVDSCCVCVVP